MSANDDDRILWLNISLANPTTDDQGAPLLCAFQPGFEQDDSTPCGKEALYGCAAHDENDSMNYNFLPLCAEHYHEFYARVTAREQQKAAGE